MLIAQISDIHLQTSDGINGPVASAVALGKALAQIAALSPAPEMLLVSGDCTEHGTAEQYSALTEAFAALPMPVYVVPGNHDRREVMRDAFRHDGNFPPHGPLHYAITRGGIRIIALDTLVEGASHGELHADSLQFLLAALAQDRKTPTLVMLHHPPVITGITAMDRIALRNRDAFWQVIGGNPQVKRVLCGHIHRSIVACEGGVVCQVAPSIQNAVAFDMSSDRLRMVNEPPGFLLHLIDGDAITTHHLHVA